MANDVHLAWALELKQAMGTCALFLEALARETNKRLSGREQAVEASQRNQSGFSSSNNRSMLVCPTWVASAMFYWWLELFSGHAISKGKIEMKKDHRGINPASKPSGDGCVECLASPTGWWLHLRRCAECGHIGCCDSSPGQHASKHAAATGHPIIASFEPGEDWFYDYEKRAMIAGAKLLPPHAHPASQPVPGPAGKVPANWESLLN